MPQLIANRYKILETLGEGAMGLVWRVLDTATVQEVALKVIAAKYRDAAKSVLQFKQEFRLMTQLRHPNCCAVYDYGVMEDGDPYFTMEIVPGQGLNDLAPLSPDRFVDAMTPLLLALGYIHQLGLVHLDVKSENVRLTPDGAVKLMDYGLMEYARRPSGFINGTLAYISPEVIRRGAIDQRTDLYSVGVLAYEMLTGRVPFDSPDPREVLQAHISAVPVPPSQLVAGVDPAHEQLVLKLLSKNPIDRYQSAYQVLEALGAEVPAGIGGALLTSPLMGREIEMRVLDVHLEAIKRGRRGGGLLVCGPSGIGKSRLIEEFRFTVQLADLICVVGFNFEHGSTPYDPWVAALRQLLPALRMHAPGELANHAPVLAQLLPELGVLAAAPMDSPTKEKLRLQASITELMVVLAARRPVVVIFEDWQWGDALSNELLDYAIRNLKDAALLFVMTSRTTPVNEPVNIDMLPVSHLSEEGLRRMVTSMLGTESVHEGFVASLAGLSKGSPFFVEKLLEHLVQSGMLVNQHGVWNTEVELAVDRLPKSLKGLLMWRLTCLSESAQAIANVAAVMGRTFTIDMLGAVAHVDDDELFQALGSLSRNQVLIETEDGAYAFAQDQIHELLYANIDAADKAQIHARVARLIERSLGGAPLTEAPFETVQALAQHGLEGGLVDPSIGWLLEAGRRNAALFANAEAEHFLASGLALIKGHAEPARFQHERLAYLATLGDVRRVVGRSDAAKDAYHEAVALAEALGERQLLARLLSWLGRCHQVLGALPEALAHVERALAVADEVGDDAVATRALILAARMAYFKGDINEAIGYAERALARARAADFTGQVGEALGMLGYFYVAADPEKARAGVEHLEQSQACLSVLGDWIALNTTLNFLGSAQNMLGDHLEARRTFMRNRQICYEIGAKDELVIALLNLAITAYELGEFLEMARYAKEAKAVAAELNSRYPHGMAICLHAVASAYTGQVAQSKELIQEALEIARELGHKYMESQVLLYQVPILLYLGQLDEAIAAADALRRLIEETGDHEPEARLNAHMAEIMARKGDFEAARAFVDRALIPAVASNAKGVQVQVLTNMALLALLSGNLGEARSVAREALEVSERVGTKHHSAILHGLLGEVALASGHQPAAAGHFAALEAIADEVGSEILAAQALFGQAATSPQTPDARKKAFRARALIEDLLAGLGDEDREKFFSHRERRRIMEGDFYAFGAPHQGATPPQAPRLGFDQGLWNKL